MGTPLCYSDDDPTFPWCVQRLEVSNLLQSSEELSRAQGVCGLCCELFWIGYLKISRLWLWLTSDDDLLEPFCPLFQISPLVWCYKNTNNLAIKQQGFFELLCANIEFSFISTACCHKHISSYSWWRLSRGNSLSMEFCILSNTGWNTIWWGQLLYCCWLQYKTKCDIGFRNCSGFWQITFS